MRNTKTKIVIILLILITLIISFASNIYASTSISSSIVAVPTTGSLPGDNIEEAYCVELGDAYGLGVPINYLATTETDADIEPSVGYAVYYVKNKHKVNNVKGTNYSRIIQDIVWSSDQWGTKENKELIKTLGVNRHSNAYIGITRSQSNDVYARSFQYGTVYYGILYKNKNIFNVDNGDLRVLADKTDNTYTVGPYYISVSDEFKEGFKSSMDGYQYNPLEILYKELQKTNAGYDEGTSFAKFTGISGVNGTNAKFISAEGKEIDFGKVIGNSYESFKNDKHEFYVKFTPNDEGALTETGTPIINIKYITGIKGVKATWNADAAEVDGLLNASDSQPVTNQNQVQSGDNGSNKYEIKFNELKIEGKGIEEYLKSYIAAKGDSLTWKNNETTLEDLQLEYTLVDSEKTKHKIEFPAKFVVVGEEKTAQKKLIPKYTISDKLSSSITKLIKDANKDTQYNLSTSELNKLKKAVEKAILSSAEKDGANEKITAFKDSIDKVVKENVPSGWNNDSKPIDNIKNALETNAKALIALLNGTISLPADIQNSLKEIVEKSKNGSNIDTAKMMDAISKVISDRYIMTKINENIVGIDANTPINDSKIKDFIDSLTKAINDNIPDGSNKQKITNEIIKSIKDNYSKYIEGIENAKVEVKKWQYNGIRTIHVKESNGKEYQLIKDEYGNVGSLYVTLQKILREERNVIQNAVQVKTDSVYEVNPPVSVPGDSTLVEGMGTIKFNSAPIDMQIGGKVWLETPSIKVEEIDGRLSDNESRFEGIEVSLYSKNNRYIATTTTDSQGIYRFYGKNADGKALVNALDDYYVIFTYDGQKYQPTFYKNDLSGGYSNAKDLYRDEENKNLEDIYSDPQNYYKRIPTKAMSTEQTEQNEISNLGDNSFTVKPGTTHKAYGYNEKIKNKDGNYILYGEGNNSALTYNDVYKEFLTRAKLENIAPIAEDDYSKTWNRNKNYESIAKDVISWLTSKEVSNEEAQSIVEYIFDTFMRSSTNVENKVYYATESRFTIKNIDENSDEYKKGGATKLGEITYPNLYSKNSDQARNVDFGLCLRNYNDLALQKDVYKATVLVNGKTEEYIYSKKSLSDSAWDIKVRASDVLYNGAEQGRYNREVKPADYELDGFATYGEGGEKKNLQVYVTYRIAVKNSGTVNTTINEIVDYYDKNQYEYYTSYIGKDADGNKLNDNVEAYETEKGLNRVKKEELKGNNYDYSRLYFSGKGDQPGGQALDVYHGENSIDKLLHPSELMFLYVTFKVKDGDYNRVKLDQDIFSGKISLGKMNIAEINGYSTYYTSGTEIPDSLDENGGKRVIKINNETTPAGIVDIDSSPGSLSNKDLDGDGNIITDPNNSVKDRQQDDTDKSPNIRLIIEQDKEGGNENLRTLSGTVFEDTRDAKQGEALMGDGQLDGKTVNGVTVQLVELVQNVEGDGINTHGNGQYIGEKVWGSYSYNENLQVSKNLERYASGANKSKVIMSGPGILAVKADELDGDKGAYSFKSVPAGDFYVRFIYGDTDETVLSSQDNDVTKLIGRKGRNEKSYNGQDYKSTVYQAGIEQNGVYNGINAYTLTDKQNYYMLDSLDSSSIYNSNIDGVNRNFDMYVSDNTNKKEPKYYYNIVNSAGNDKASDAKDVWDYRDRERAYSKGYENETLLNYRAEVLASHEKIATYKEGEDIKARQEGMVKELTDNTYMVAQSGVINTEIEKARTVTKYGDSLNYKLDHINLGLVERPEAGLKLAKEIDNFSVVLSNGRTLFNVSNDQSVGNLSFDKHDEHEIKYENDNMFSRISNVLVNSNIETTDARKKSAELLQVYIDDELMQGSTLAARYKLTVTNIGEVDYDTSDFYYLGKPGSEDTKTTTDAINVIDYVTNAIRYDASLNKDASWNVTKVDELITAENENKNLVNKKYNEELGTYDTILTTGGLYNKDKKLKPGDSNNTSLIVSTVLSNSNTKDQLTYNNLAEIIATKNSVGRRNVYSISGNEQMADQSLGNNGVSNRDNPEIYTKEDRVKPQEIDADSAQEIKALPPTGSGKSFENDVKTIIATVAVVMLGAYIVRLKIKY